MRFDVSRPSDEAKRQALENPGGWVYAIDGTFGPTEDVPAGAVVGAWRVDERGEIVGDFIANPNYCPDSES
jgi:hypothetical protein